MIFIMKKMIVLKEEGLDTSNYTVNRPLKASVNKKVLGLMKDELGGLIIEQKYILSNL